MCVRIMLEVNHECEEVTYPGDNRSDSRPHSCGTATGSVRRRTRRGPDTCRRPSLDGTLEGRHTGKSQVGSRIYQVRCTGLPRGIR